MGRTKENPRYNIVTARIDDETKDNIKLLCRKSNSTISEVTQQALKFYFQANLVNA